MNTYNKDSLLGIFNMVRDWKSIHKLQALEDRGYCVVNSGYGIENCTREKMTRLLLSNHISHPRSLILQTTEDPIAQMEEEGFYNCWIKRGDFHAIHRGIPSAVINEHLVGDLVKFYGVAGTDFFYWFYPSNMHHSKFGLEAINGTAKGLPFDEQTLQTLCNEAAKVLHVEVYGGDCIVDEEGTIRLIDFNDWPSFAPCREAAAPYIARRIYDIMSERLS